MSEDGTARGEQAQDLPRLMRLREVAERAQVSLWTVRAEIKRGNLIASRIGRILRVTPDDYRMWIAGLRGGR